MLAVQLLQSGLIGHEKLSLFCGQWK